MRDSKLDVDRIKNDSLVKRWLEGLSPSTQKGYSYALAEFCFINQIIPRQMLRIVHNEEQESIPNWDRSVNLWFENYDEYIKERKMTKKSRNTKIAIVKAFFHHYEYNTPKMRKINNSFENDPNRRKSLKKSDIRKMLESCKTWKMRAIILTGVSSGLSSADIVQLKVKDFRKGIKKTYDDRTKSVRTICKLSLNRIKTNRTFTTFLSEEAIKTINKYLEVERDNPKDNEPLFCRTKKDLHSMTAEGVQVGYRRLNGYLGWKQDKKGRYRKATSHMARKFFNTQLIIAGMPEEIREHFMGHKISNQVRDAYFLEDTDALERVYLQYVDNITIGPVKPPVTMSEYVELKGALDDTLSKYKKMKEAIDEKDKMIANMELKNEENMEVVKREMMENMNTHIDNVIEKLVEPYNKKDKPLPPNIIAKKRILKDLKQYEDEEDEYEDEEEIEEILES